MSGGFGGLVGKDIALELLVVLEAESVVVSDLDGHVRECRCGFVPIGVIQSAQVPDCGSFGMLGVLSKGVCGGISGRLVIGESYFCWGVCRDLV